MSFGFSRPNFKLRTVIINDFHGFFPVPYSAFRLLIPSSEGTKGWVLLPSPLISNQPRRINFECPMFNFHLFFPNNLSTHQPNNFLSSLARSLFSLTPSPYSHTPILHYAHTSLFTRASPGQKRTQPHTSNCSGSKPLLIHQYSTFFGVIGQSISLCF